MTNILNILTTFNSKFRRKKFEIIKDRAEKPRSLSFQSCIIGGKFFNCEICKTWKYCYKVKKTPHFICKKCISDKNDTLTCKYFGCMGTFENHKIILYNNRNDILFSKLMCNNKWNQCPGCKRVVQKNGGCDIIHCICGKDWRYFKTYED